MGVLPASVYELCELLDYQEGIRSLELRNTDGCEPPGGCWKSNSSHQEEQPVPLTAESSIHLASPPVSTF